jgi:hypothetical protein
MDNCGQPVPCCSMDAGSSDSGADSGVNKDGGFDGTTCGGPNALCTNLGDCCSGYCNAADTCVSFCAGFDSTCNVTTDCCVGLTCQPPITPIEAGMFFPGTGTCQ